MFLEAEVWTIARTDKGNAVLIRPLEGTLAVPIFIGSLEAQNILLGMGEMDIPRPLTHDLILSLLKYLDSEIMQVEIHTIKEGTFFANIYLQKDGKQIAVDARPSDALALAVRTQCPVFIEESIVDEVGIPVSSVKSGDLSDPENDQGQADKNDRDILEEDLRKAVAEENYEEAAKLRDKLKSFHS